LSEYAATWLDHRRVRGMPLAPRTKILFAGLLANHILPEFGDVELRRLDTARVRTWHRQLTGAAGPGASTVAKSYRLLHAIFATAVSEEDIRRNSCVLPGQARNRSQRDPHLASRRSSRSLRQFLRVGAHWSCSPRTAVSASASWQPFAVITSTWSGQ